MANKKINELTELTTASGSDYFVVYDNDESSSEKTKKIQTENIQFVAEITANNSTINGIIAWDGEAYPICRMVGQLIGDGDNITAGVRINGNSGNLYVVGQTYQDGSTPLSARTIEDHANLFRRASTGANSVVSTRATLFLKNLDPRSKTWECVTARYGDDNSDRQVNTEGGFFYDTSELDVTYLQFISLGPVTGYIRLYRM